MTANQKIAQSALLAAQGRMPSVALDPGWCLRVVRLIVEHALFENRYEMYSRWLVAGTTARPGTDAERVRAARANPFASDFEASMKQLGLTVPMFEREPGDLVFNHKLASPYGHVAVLMTRDLALENINPRSRPTGIRLPVANLVLTPVESVEWTLCARLPDPDPN